MPMLTDDDRRRPIAIGHLSDSGDLKITCVVNTLVIKRKNDSAILTHFNQRTHCFFSHYIETFEGNIN